MEEDRHETAGEAATAVLDEDRFAADAPVVMGEHHVGERLAAIWCR